MYLEIYCKELAYALVGRSLASPDSGQTGTPDREESRASSQGRPHPFLLSAD